MAVRGYPAFAVHLYTKLAEVRIAQGRLAEAEELLAGNEDNAVTARALGKLCLAKGEAERAVSLITRRLSIVSRDSLQSAPLYAILTEAKLALGDLTGAAEAAGALVSVAAQTGSAACIAAGEYATGLVALAGANPRAWVHFETALGLFSSLEMPFEVARSRLGMASALRESDPSGAADMARRARAEFERLGAARELDRSAEVLRELGVGTGPGRRTDALLSEREQEVLACLSQGLSNAEIGKQLFISPKTAEHHVGKILAKLGLKNRAAAAVYVVKQGRSESDAK
jgi:DNA-binding NarL/FixJ family response regulator